MRKLLSTLMATAIFALVIAGCSKNSDPYNPPTPTPPRRRMIKRSSRM